MAIICNLRLHRTGSGRVLEAVISFSYTFDQIHEAADII